MMFLFWFVGYMFTLGYLNSEDEPSDFVENLISFFIWPIVLGKTIRDFCDSLNKKNSDIIQDKLDEI